jgi:quercetin dioxygenase-like cupin family protein
MVGRALALVPASITAREGLMPQLKGFASLGQLPSERITDKIERRVLAGDQGMIVWWSMKAGAHVAPHQHPHEQIAWVVRGRMEFRIGSERHACGPGDVAVIPGGVEHEGWFPEDTEVIDVFAPPREDFLAGGPPSYMQEPKRQKR